MDMDGAITHYFDKVIKPSVEDNGENVKVPIMYASPERWKAIQRDGFMRDKKDKLLHQLLFIVEHLLKKMNLYLKIN